MSKWLRTHDLDGPHPVQNLLQASQLQQHTTLSISNGFLQQSHRHRRRIGNERRRFPSIPDQQRFLRSRRRQCALRLTNRTSNDGLGMILKDLDSGHVPSMWTINQQGLPGTGEIDPEAMVDLLHIAQLAIGCFEDETLLGFVLCLQPGTRYGSLNYAWFNQHYESFLYVDRIAVHENHRNQAVGSLLYQKVIEEAEAHHVPVAAEVSANPPNPGSMRFHHRFSFEQVGELDHGEKSVVMLMRDSNLTVG